MRPTQTPFRRNLLDHEDFDSFSPLPLSSLLLATALASVVIVKFKYYPSEAVVSD